MRTFIPTPRAIAPRTTRAPPPPPLPLRRLRASTAPPLPSFGCSWLRLQRSLMRRASYMFAARTPPPVDNNNNNNAHAQQHQLPASATDHAHNALVSRPSPVRILFLISDTGGGHRASAQALSAAFDELYPGRVHHTIVDFWTEIVGQPFHNFPHGYSFLANNPPLWRAAWQYGRFPLTRRLTEEFANALGNQNFRRALRRFQPHVIVSVHPLTQFIPLRVLRTMRTRLPFVTVCTDLGGAHPTWFHRDVDLCFVPTDRVRAIAERCGLGARQLRQYGLPVRSDFWREAREKHAVRTQLQLRSALPTVLIVGGGDGVGGVGRIALCIAHKLRARLGADGAQLVVVCGKNERLRQQLRARSWPLRSVHVHGFVHNMSEWMAASDLIVSKAGPGTIAEALIRGLPIVLSGFLPGQEAPNVRYVTDAGVGAFSRDPQRIGDIVSEWLSEPALLRERARRAKRLARPSATYDIVRDIGALLRLERAVL
eukprot:TRINITY_DN168_c1_g1_i10.p1 TRINITY_DN168_c1_g1~~TRINITY_DN168_c1_g1_i10.p1  ORF type:complete len:484 (-),score=140.01 TRINITY_DN168_c1_g1_i10:553-2004(-)